MLPFLADAGALEGKLPRNIFQIAWITLQRYINISPFGHETFHTEGRNMEKRHLRCWSLHELQITQACIWVLVERPLSLVSMLTFSGLSLRGFPDAAGARDHD